MNALTPSTTADALPTLSTCNVSRQLWRLLNSNSPADIEVEEICSDPVLHEESRRVSGMLQEVAAPCGRSFVQSALEHLVLVFGVGVAAETRAFWATYKDALEGVPRESLVAAIKEYTASADAEFFPKPGPLKALALKHAEPLYKAAYRAKRAADSLPRQKPTEETLEERQRVAAEVLKLVGSTKSPA